MAVSINQSDHSSVAATCVLYSQQKAANTPAAFLP
jgi:hypothetical protein